MLIKTQGIAIELLNNSIPYPQQMKEIDFSVPNSIYFTWRSQRYKLDFHYCRVDKVNGSMLEGDDCSILMTQLLKSRLGLIL